MVLPIKTGIMLWAMYLPTDTGAPIFMPKGICSNIAMGQHCVSARQEDMRAKAECHTPKEEL